MDKGKRGIRMSHDMDNKNVPTVETFPIRFDTGPKHLEGSYQILQATLRRALQPCFWPKFVSPMVGTDDAVLRGTAWIEIRTRERWPVDDKDYVQKETTMNHEKTIEESVRDILLDIEICSSVPVLTKDELNKAVGRIVTLISTIARRERVLSKENL